MALTKEQFKEKIASGISYEAYRSLINTLQAEGRSTAMDDNSDRVYFTGLNVKRMDRLDKKMEVLDSIKLRMTGLGRAYTFLLLAESWCADASQIVPVIARFADVNAQIDLKILLRDEHLDLMDQFLTNGGRAIPKLILLDKETLEIVGEWGPRPETANAMAKDYKEEHRKIDETFKVNLQKWYNKNKGVEIQEELMTILEKAEETIPV
jgi:hypothetical protein